MRIVTIKDPWAWAIMRLGKDVENRVRNIAGDYRGPVAIHVAATPMKLDDYFTAAKYIAERTGIMPIASLPGSTGVIIGVVDLVAVHEDACSEPGDAECGGCCTPWAMHDFWHLVLKNPRPLAEPIPYTGALGLRRLDDETIARIEAAIA